MYVIYVFSCETLNTTILCHTEDPDRACCAMDEYAQRWYEKATKRKIGEDEDPYVEEIPKEAKEGDLFMVWEEPLEDEFLEDNDRNPADIQRIEVLKSCSDSEDLELVRTYGVQKVDKWIDDYLDERTAAVEQIEEDQMAYAKYYVPKDLPEGSDEEEEETTATTTTTATDTDIEEKE